MENKEQVYTQGGGEKWTDYEDMMNDLRENYNIGEEVEVWEADKVEWNHSDFFNLEIILQDMQSEAIDRCGDVAEEYLDDVTATDSEEIEKYILDWLNKNAKLNFYGVENAKKIMVIVE